MDAVGILDDLIDVIGEGVFHLVEGVHLEGAAALAGHTVVVPPRELRDEDGLVVAFHQEVVDGVLEDFLAAVCQEHALLGHTVDLAETDGNDTFLTLIVYTCIEAEILRIKVLHGVKHFLAWLKVEFVSVEVVHISLFFIIFIRM